MATRREFGSGGRGARGRSGRGRLGSTHANTSLQRYGLPSGTESAPSNLDQRFEEIKRLDALEERFSFERYNSGPERLGWLINMHATLVPDPEWAGGRAGVDYYFLDENGETFKVTLVHSPYFYIGCKPGTEGEVEEYLRRRFENTIERVKRVQREDLKMPNHLIGRKRVLIQLFFRNVSDLLSVRKILLPAAQKNREKTNAVDTYAEVVSETNHIRYDPGSGLASMSSRKNFNEAIENIIDIREYDVPYYVRVAIDLNIRVGVWYTAKAMPDETVVLTRREDLVQRPDPVTMAFDIETTKSPLKFPDATVDSIMMISYMIDGNGYLITNREIVSEDIADFHYTPKPEYQGEFTIFNEANEYEVIRRFFEHIQQAKPTIYVTYNGDFFDWPFIEARAKANGMDMYEEIGVYKDEEDEYKCKHASHMDAFRWVKRDSYLPQGSQGLKAVTTAKLGYNPMELDPEDMTRFAAEKPQTLAQYSVSDAVATYYLYMKYVHPFIFSLCNIIPLVPDEVLRKGTGTLCELLLMVEAYNVSVIIPNKHVEETNKMFEGHLLESETYVGGHVEALEAGVFRSDIDTHFKVDPSAAQQLIDQLDSALKFTLQVEEKQKLDNIANYQEVYDDIKKRLEDLRDNPIRHEGPLIYHLDVAAMYPNIILTNRLQPDSMIDESMCATCEFNLPDKTCDRRMTWSWRGEYFPAKRNEYMMIRNQLSTETFPPKRPTDPPRPWHALTDGEQSTMIRKRLTDYSKKVYKKVRETKTFEREDIICQRENPFYVDTVKAFRDRRYEYKGLHKKWKQNLDKASSGGSLKEADEAKKMIVLYDSLQLAHKCILNSFYGYVMRKGARWHSLEMAGIVCLTGARIIQMARQLVERIGRPLELDTDGIWCILPKSFPETFAFTTKSGKKIKIDYPCTMLNHLVHDKFTNHQYQQLVDEEKLEYSVHSENSIFFEIDGPYRAMILPASTVEDKLLKKRYAVFNDDGSLAELKGFEVKRRGELKLIKDFQSEIFKVFLEGLTLETCYESVARVANQWLDILYSKAVNLHDDELFQLISENRSMSKTLEDYGSQKSTAISTAKRLAEFLGDEMVKDKGLACKFIISARPYGVPVSERAIPVTIFSAEPDIKRHYLRKWLKDNSLTSFDIRDILDWPYYLERFASVIQKLITIPAAMQKVNNPVPRVPHPDWLHKRMVDKDDKYKQHRITDMFTRVEKPGPLEGGEDVVMQDIEELDVGSNKDGQQINGSAFFGPRVSRVNKRKQASAPTIEEDGPLPEEDRPENMPDMHTDYQGFLEFQKRKWKRQRVMRAKNRETYGASQPAAKQGDVGGYFRRQTGSLVSSAWELIQIAGTDTPGEFKMWAMVQGRLTTISLQVPRIFYLNSREEAPSTLAKHGPTCQVAKCVRTLPRSRPCLNLFEIAMSEADFQAEIGKIASIFNDPATEGAYETSLPLIIRALLLLGNQCKLKKDLTGSSRIEDQFNVLDLVPQLDAKSRYFDSAKEFQYVYLHHVSMENRHLFILMGAALPKSHCFVVGVSESSKQVPNVRRMYSEFYNVMIKDKPDASTTVEMKSSLEFETTYCNREKDALRGINKVLAQYRDSRRGAMTMLVVRSPRNVSVLTQHARLINEYPYMAMPPSNKVDSMQALSWLQPAVKRALTSYLNLGNWVDQKIEQARYANVPLCNIPDDSYTFIADILFARRLHKSDMLLWWSSGSKPDLGGREKDDNAVEEPEWPEISNPAAYQNVCIEMDVMRLCLNTIMESHLINELEGTSDSTGFDNTSHTLDEYSNGLVNNTSAFSDGMVSARTFGVLRATVQQWFHESIGQDSQMGDNMVDVLHRWLQSPKSSMHDPSLYALVHGLMKKVFMQFMAECKRLGATVVFANFHRVILATTKDTMESAMPYGEYIFRSIQAKRIFEVLDLHLVDYWQLLVWMDEQNHGGMVSKVNDQSKVVMIWNVMYYLPPAVQETFRQTIALYIKKTHQFKVEYPRDIRRQIATMDVDGEEGANGNSKQGAEEKEDERTKHMRLFIKELLTARVLKFVTETIHKQDHSAEFEFPQLSGSHLKLSNPVLECVKSICAVLGLDSSLEHEVRLLKRNALQAIGGLSDFSAEAQFRNPCEYYKLTEVICTTCNFPSDLDFCRDPELQPAADGSTKPWPCRGCCAPYDKKAIEQRMVSQVQRWMTSYQLQDLQCMRCRVVKRENLMKQCDRCGSDFVVIHNKAELTRKLRVFANIAQEQHFTHLSEMVQWTLLSL
ncbi:hypothetical protein BDB00DRAFT_875783 [Zychaea mexicana]|uniref:uncharacterized protein n=1 Tax=Zychaea mexicana TaxID=64656 RepID=UPI0022FDDDD6|nr:uncharacterized protein BDB00DRAFT_875783 [Zychaea mexicana]KAI9489936.1 hypothetical protein BDB00DRAFT_875783 [Zychaea mexicana]